jgi:uncharacterized protein
LLKRSILKEILIWTKDVNRKPLLLRGARQVGKTSIVREVGKLAFDQFFELNFEDRAVARSFQSPLSIDEFLAVLKVNYGFQPNRPNTLIFFDEIQEVPWVIELLRFFYDLYPEVAVIASGSLLEIKLSKNKISMPVGRIQNLFMYPMDFFEYLEAKGESSLLDFLKGFSIKESIPESIHIKAINLFNEYVIVGGMPEVVREMVNDADDKKLTIIKSSLLETYLQDVSKYTTSRSEPYLAHVLDNAPAFAGQRFNYAKFAQSKYRSDSMRNAFSVLANALILFEVNPTEHARIPFIAQSKRQRKIIFMDVGLVSQKFGLGRSSPIFNELNEIFRGQIGEQVVGQQLISLNTTSRPKLFYWSKQSTEGEAEVDFLLADTTKVIAIEVKSGKLGRLRSLLSLATSYPDATLCRICSSPPSVEQFSGKTVITVPFYLINRLMELV